MFNRKPFNEKFLLTRKYYDFTLAINCTRKLNCMCAIARARVIARVSGNSMIIISQCLIQSIPLWCEEELLIQVMVY